MNSIRSILFCLIYLFLWALSASRIAIATPEVTPPDGAQLTNALVNVCWPAVEGAVAYRLSFYEANWAGNNFENKLFLSPLVVGSTCFDHDFSGMGSTTIRWSYVSLNAEGVVLGIAGVPVGQLYSFSLIGMGPNIDHIPDLVNNNSGSGGSCGVGVSSDLMGGESGQKEGFRINLDNSLNKATKGKRKNLGKRTSKRISLRAEIVRCAKDRISKLPRITQTIKGIEDSTANLRRRNAMEVRAKARCRKNLLKEKERHAGRGDHEDNPWSITCSDEDPSNPGHYVMLRSCPEGMSVDSHGIFQYRSSVPARILVDLQYNDGKFFDHQKFWAISISGPLGHGGVSPPLTEAPGLVDVAVSECSTFSTVYPVVIEAYPTLSGTWPYFAIDGSVVDSVEVWRPGSNPSNPGRWRYTIKINAEVGQQMNLVDYLMIKFGRVVGSAMPRPSDILVEYAIGSCPDSLQFIPLNNPWLPGNMHPMIECDLNNPDCEWRMKLGVEVTHVRISGQSSHLRPLAIHEIGFFGWRGEIDCDVGAGRDQCPNSGDNKWRNTGYLDANHDCVPDLFAPVIVTAPSISSSPDPLLAVCYGPASDLIDTDYLASENAGLTPLSTSSCNARKAGRSPT